MPSVQLCLWFAPTPYTTSNKFPQFSHLLSDSLRRSGSCSTPWHRKFGHQPSIGETVGQLVEMLARCQGKRSLIRCPFKGFHEHRPEPKFHRNIHQDAPQRYSAAQNLWTLGWVRNMIVSWPQASRLSRLKSACAKEQSIMALQTRNKWMEIGRGCRMTDSLENDVRIC